MEGTYGGRSDGVWQRRDFNSRTVIQIDCWLSAFLRSCVPAFLRNNAGKLFIRCASRLDHDLNRLALVHRTIPVRHFVEFDGAVEHPAGMNSSLKHIG